MKTPAPQRAASRKKLAAKKQALPDGSFPVPNVDYLRRAIRSVGRAPASKRPALKALIRKRARELGATNAPGVKGTWAFQGSNADSGRVIDLAYRYKHGWIRIGGEADKHIALAKTADAEGRHADAINHLGAALGHVTDKSAAHHLTELKKEMTARAMGVPYKPKPMPKRLHAMANTTTGGVELATTTRRMPIVRGTADVQASRTAPGTVTVMHKSTGMKVGTLTTDGKGWQAVHASGAKTPGSGSMAGAMAGLITAHNRMARGETPQQDSAASYTADPGGAVDLAGALPYMGAVTSGDGPRVTSMGAGKAASTVPPECAAVYAKLRKKGMGHGQALALAKRAAAMKAKAS